MHVNAGRGRPGAGPACISQEPGHAAPASLEPPDWGTLLPALAASVRNAAILSAGSKGTGATNAKGDAVRAFDLEAHRAIVRFLEQAGVDALLLSEEGAPRLVGKAPARWRLIVDPVDGSDNFARALPLSAFSCAVLPAEGPLSPERVLAALIAPMEGAARLLALAGRGAWQLPDEREAGIAARLRTSGVRRLADALVSVELNHHAPAPALARLMARARGVRSYGCASRALALVAAGALDAHIDLRARLTGESWLAASLLLREAGGAISGPDGAPVPAMHGLLDRRAIIAAATPALLDAILEELARHAPEHPR